MIKDIRHIQSRLHEVDMLIMLLHDSLAVAEDSPEVIELIKADISILLELVMRLQDELNS
jgi:hypothetical protein